VSDFRARPVVSAEVSHVIVRACTRCQHPRVIGTPCAGCGNPEPPVVHDLGVQAATYRNPLKRLWWHVARQPLATRRAHQAARYTPQ
jgi:hypothetical protein